MLGGGGTPSVWFSASTGSGSGPVAASAETALRVSGPMTRPKPRPASDSHSDLSASPDSSVSITSIENPAPSRECAARTPSIRASDARL